VDLNQRAKPLILRAVVQQRYSVTKRIVAFVRRTESPPKTVLYHRALAIAACGAR
jgi:hypothetical protein